MTPAKKRRRWRLVLPFVPVVAVVAVALTAHAVEQTDPSEATYLAPTSPADQGGRDLAELLRARGVSILTDTRTGDALARMKRLGSDVTLFIPAPRFVHPDYRDVVDLAPDGATVVLVEPGSELGDFVPTLGVADRRWATAVTGPGPDCPLTTAAPAAVARTRYLKVKNSSKEPVFCYEHGLAQLNYNGVEFIAVGSDDPFRADRLAEHDNSRFAADLLSRHRTLIWLDLHTLESPRPTSPTVVVTTSPSPGATLPPDVVYERPNTEPGEQSDDGDNRDSPQSSSDDWTPPSPFPDWTFWTVLLLLVAGVLLALAKGRRLGAPAVEPLPVEVRGAETALGRARLYLRARARGPVLDVLRADARVRLRTALGLPSTADRQQLVDALDARLPGRRTELDRLLYGNEPTSESELHARATELKTLVETVTGTRINEGEHR
ncbi:DUF4350 domain-containing protein [Catellatospora tritici]|uniref:DUF4350 domain-containing protein n=1 Tax=Catellatospora tritici TaxID=2851566 RepID=UPI001C2DCAE3|nr:DUF4350 domain-containing protein [Catellatospora tritici]MBV1849479.1 DUF4350 domain-containing protein [Catellatospora tritici]MBV1854051.1 DUF4350 domain-containing protein [Catellatospora tritici]